MNTEFVKDLAARLARNVPQGVQAATDDLEQNFTALLQSAFARLDLVTREEFDVQRKVLERSREKLVALEAELARLEAERQPGSDVKDSA